MGNVVFKAQIEDYLNNLIFNLYQDNYFGFIESSYEYIEDLIRYIYKNIAHLPQKKVPIQLSHLGSKYITYNSSKKTTWYILFDKKDGDILITYIFNNHEKYAAFLDL